MTDNVRFSCWLTFDQRGINKMFKNRPALHKGEKSMRVELTVPKAVFREPDLVAAIELQGEPAPEHRCEIVASVKEALDAIPEVFVSVPPVEVDADAPQKE